MLRSCLLLLLLLGCTALSGQTLNTEYYPEDETPAFLFDPEIFAAPTWSAADPFRDFSRFRFGAVRYRERGLDSRHFRVALGGVDLTDNMSSRPDWGLVTLARRGGMAALETPAMVAGALPAGMGRAEEYSLNPAADDFYMALRTGDRYSLAGGDMRLGFTSKSGWSGSFAATGQTGDDTHLGGVYSDEAGGAAALSKRWNERAALTLFVTGGLSERGSRTAATAEAFDLTGDRLYNPTWGRQAGRVRNSRLTRSRHALAAVELTLPLGGERVMSVILAGRLNRGGRTRLAWYDATSPMPDYYRVMPSFFPEWEATEAIADAWRAGEETVTGVDWDRLYYNNTLAADGRATYMVEEHVDAARDLHAALTVNRRVDGRLGLSYGMRVRSDVSRRYKLADDMLGAVWVPNVDQYVTDTDGEYHTAPPNENDLQNPGRRVERGDRFGYDYRMTRFVPSVFGILRWRGQGGGITASTTLAHTRLRRNGFYEKELFPGELSLGPSDEVAFNTWSLSVAAWLSVGARHGFSLAAMVATEPPAVDNLFLSPAQNNLTVAAPVPSGLYGAEVSWVFGGESVDVRLGGFVNATTGETWVKQYYDDLSSTFADMVVRGVDRLGYGFEAGVEARVASWLSLALGGSTGRYRYNSEPTATLHDDSSGEVFAHDIVCYMSGLATGPPSHAAGAEVSFSGRRYLRFSLSGEWLGGRWVEINPLYHSSRVAGINSAPEIMAAFTSQERLADAFTLGVSLSKGWVVGRGFFRIAGSVRNVLSSAIVHSGYEQMRIRRLGTGLDRTLVPFPAKYLYSYPMTWSVTASYRL